MPRNRVLAERIGDPDGARRAADPGERGPLIFDDVSLTLRSQRLLVGFSAIVGSGETLAVMGRSGAGKTTLLRAVAGLVAPSNGRITGAGRTAMVFQDPRLMPWRTALENVAVVLPRRDRGAARAWLDRVGLAEVADVYPGALSGGMRQRVSIARALATHAPTVLVDEPFSNLDARTAGSLRDDLTGHLREGGHTVVWVTHDRAEALAVADRILTMDGPPDGGWHLDGSSTQPSATPGP